MIEYINKRMIDWAIWAKRRDDGGLGYPGRVNFARLSAGSSSHGNIVSNGAEMEIESIVARFKQQSPMRYAVAYWIYLAGDMTVNRVAAELGCSRDTVYTRLHALHVAVMEALNDNAVNERVRPALKIVYAIA